ncbi:MAG: hypothetical protein IJX67_01805 [Oscillospiraceae bacterium]|nr:hypothetical protein [Oscillospiraceae bacterium]
MRRILCTSIALLLLLTACSAPVQQLPPITEPDGDYAYSVYEFTFDTERVSGWPVEGWDFVYIYNGEKIQSGHQILFSLELFSFHSIQVDVTERDNPKNSFSATFPVAICDGGSGKTEITVTGSNGKTATFKVTCEVTQVGKR